MKVSSDQVFPAGVPHPGNVRQENWLVANPNPFIIQPNAPYSNVPRSDLPRPSKRIHDYLLWSVLNLCFGVCFLGIIAIACSAQVRKYRGAGNISKANKFSTCTLIANIVATVAELALWGFLIYAVVTFV